MLLLVPSFADGNMFFCLFHWTLLEFIVPLCSLFLYVSFALTLAEPSKCWAFSMLKRCTTLNQLVTHSHHLEPLIGAISYDIKKVPAFLGADTWGLRIIHVKSDFDNAK